MLRIRKTLMMAVVAAMTLAACAPQATMMAEEPAMAVTQTPQAMMESTAAGTMMESTPADSMMESTPADGMMESTPADTMMEKTPEDAGAMMEAPAWFNVDLTNAATGETFKVADLTGKVVLVETMAQWCTNCMQQQRQVIKLHENLGMRDDLVTLGVDVDPNEDLATLKTYIERNGFDWVYTVAPAEVSNDLASLYGDQFLNPTSTPMLIIDRKGGVHPLPFGIKNADDLQKALEPFLNDGM